MRKLELKDIVGYLPYDLNIVIGGSIYRVTNISIEASCVIYTDRYRTYSDCIWIQDVKPILRPMSDISKEITVKGYNEDKPFIPIIKIAEFCNPHMMGWKIDGKGRAYTRDNGWPQWVSPEQVKVATFDIFDLLNKWHFDYRGLIDEGLAVDINNFNA